MKVLPWQGISVIVNNRRRSFRAKLNHSAEHNQFQSSPRHISRAVSEAVVNQYQSNCWADSEQLSGQSQASFRAVSEQFQSSFRTQPSPSQFGAIHRASTIQNSGCVCVFLPQTMSSSRDASRCSPPTPAGPRRNRSAIRGRSYNPNGRCPAGRRSCWLYHTQTIEISRVVGPYQR